KASRRKAARGRSSLLAELKESPAEAFVAPREEMARQTDNADVFLRIARKMHRDPLLRRSIARRLVGDDRSVVDRVMLVPLGEGTNELGALGLRRGQDRRRRVTDTIGEQLVAELLPASFDFDLEEQNSGEV